MNKAWAIVLVLPLLMLACSAEAGDGSTEGAALDFANALCPMMGDPVEQGQSFDFRGHQIGFCCDGCISKFEKLDDTQKIAKLAEAGFTVPQ